MLETTSAFAPLQRKRTEATWIVEGLTALPCVYDYPPCQVSPGWGVKMEP
jgi:hypothetical protein